MAIPSSPGFVGTYQWLAVSSLGLFDVERQDALAFSLLLHASWYVPTTIVGGALSSSAFGCGVRYSSSKIGLDEAEPIGVPDRLGAILDAELAVDVRQVEFDGLLRDPEFLRDFLVR